MTQSVNTRDVLTQVEAEERARRTQSASYRLLLDLHKGSPTYRGDVELRFEVVGEGNLFIDYRGKSIEKLELNGREIEAHREGHRLVLPGQALEKQNLLRVVYENEYDHGGDGFHQFVDPEDGEEYLYTNFEPFEAHRLFPCFDQPDIKGDYHLTVIAPGDWAVVSNSAEIGAEDQADGRVRREFAPTNRFSTYLFAVVAGPYHVARDRHGEIELGLYCRKSMAKYLDTDELFTVSKQGLDFFADFFDYPYPWGKYDQLFVPEFNAGAMENVGCVTHNEYMVFRDPPTESQRRRRTETVLHEMAHMWFGDLVTMRWWNDLWLNESFATYMSYLCMDEATRFDGGWQDFNAVIKNWAYREDQMVTTHPISGTVADTDETFLNFDGITYGKGASVLKQLVRTIGMDGFRGGMRHYFRTHAYGNATLEQFLESLEAGSGQSLKAWSELWLETASLNTIAAEIESDGDRISSLTLRQSAPQQWPTLRPHTLDIGMSRREDGGVLTEVVAAVIDGETADVEAARGKATPELVLPNYGDHGYVKLALDDASVRFAREHLELIDDVLTRQLLWSALWSMTRDQKLKAQNFLELVRRKIPGEPEIQMAESVIAYATAALTRYIPAEMRDEQAHLLFQTAWDTLPRAGEGDAQIVWARTIFSTAVVPEDVRRALELVDGKISIPGLTVDQQMRWTMATRCAALDFPGAAERIAIELERDPSDRGQRAKLQCETSFPSAAVKEEAWRRIHGEGYGSLYLTEAAMGGFNWWRQRELLKPYVERFFQNVQDIFATRDKEFASSYFRSLYPSYRVERAILERSERILAEIEGSMPTLYRTMREAIDELDRAIRCQEFAREG